MLKGDGVKKVAVGYQNGLGEIIDIEPEFLYPMLKGSDLANGNISEPKRWMLVPQKVPGADTNVIADAAPMTWAYLQQHRELLDRRSSIIYKNNPSFSVFGVGPYSFAPWKVAISGFSKKLDFRVVGTYQGKPTVFDDTSYSVPCRSKNEADYIASILNSDSAKGFFDSLIFRDTKRPITVDLLGRLDLSLLAQELDAGLTFDEILNQYPGYGVQGTLEL